MNRPLALACSSIALCLPLWGGCSRDSIDNSAQPVELSTEDEDLRRTLIGKAEQDLIKLLGEPDKR
jgi:hypothetical protein